MVWRHEVAHGQDRGLSVDEIGVKGGQPGQILDVRLDVLGEIGVWGLVAVGVQAEGLQHLQLVFLEQPFADPAIFAQREPLEG